MTFINSKRILNSKILVITIIISIFLIPTAFGQNDDFYEDVVGVYSKDKPNILDTDFVFEEFTNFRCFAPKIALKNAYNFGALRQKSF